MVIEKTLIQTPYKKYSVLVNSVTVRKLTIIEWTLLRVVNGYSAHPRYREKNLAFFFEKILGMDRSELLIRPCVNSLQRLKLIEIEDYSSLALASETAIGKIHLTKEGIDALQHNYIPGDNKETEEVIYYDLIRQVPVENYTGFIPDSNHPSKRITHQSNFKMPYPSDEILSAINNGSMFRSKYHANSVIAQKTTCNQEEEFWNTEFLTLEENDFGELSCNFPLNNDIQKQLLEMISAPIHSIVPWPIWNIDDAYPASRFHGNNAINDIVSYIDYTDYLFVQFNIWEDFSNKMKKSLNGVTCIILGSPEFDINVSNFTAVYVPFTLSDPRILIASPGHDAIYAAVSENQVEDLNVNIWFSYHKVININLSEWLYAEAVKMSEFQSDVISLIFLPVVGKNENICLGTVQKILSEYGTLSEKISFLEALNSRCGELRIAIPNYANLTGELIDSIDMSSAETVCNDITYCYQNLYSDCEDSQFEELVLDVALEYGLRSGMGDCLMILSTILQVKDIDLSRFAKNVDKRVLSRISGANLDTLFNDFAYSCPKQLPVLSKYVQIYNTLAKSMEGIQELLHNFDWYAKIDRDVLLDNIVNCKALSTVHDTAKNISGMINKLHAVGCTVFEPLQPCSGIMEHLSALQKLVDLFVVPNGKMSKIYLIDTCAFLHSPDILSYFSKDEMVRIPFTVLRELDHHKDSNPDLSLKKCAAYACKQIEENTFLCKSTGNLHFSVESQDYPELLPAGFDKHKHDDLILSAALHYKLFQPRIITDDTNFRNIARTQGIQPIAWDSFIRERGGTPTRDKSSFSFNEEHPQTSPSKIEEKNDANPESVSEPACNNLRNAPLFSVAKRFSINSSELSMLLSHKIITCGNLVDADARSITSMYTKKKAFMATRILEVRKRIKDEIKRINNESASKPL